MSFYTDLKLPVGAITGGKFTVEIITIGAQETATQITSAVTSSGNGK